MLWVLIKSLSLRCFWWVSITFFVCFGVLHPFQHYLTLILRNNLISHTHFWLSANQITSYDVFVQIHKLNDKNSVDPDQMASSEAIWSGPTLFAKVGVVVNSKIKVKSYGDDGRGVMKGTEQLSIVPKTYIFIRCGFRGVQGVRIVHSNSLPPFDKIILKGKVGKI